MKRTSTISAFVLATALSIPAISFAHDTWIEPSATVLSGEPAEVTFDAAAGNDKFYYNHRPLSLDNLVITSPAGKTVDAENPFKGALRSSFDLTLTEDGTYRVALVTNGGVFARWKEGKGYKRWFGTAKDMDQHVPKDAEDLTVRERFQRIETFVTRGNPTDLQPVEQGLALAGTTHPNDLYAGEKAQFALTLDGEPAKNIDVEVVRDGSRYRDAPETLSARTDDQGRFEIAWPKPGLYWLHAELKDGKTASPNISERGVSYSATLEVLPQ